MSWVTSASVSLADCFFVFLLPIHHDSTGPGSLQINLERAHVFCRVIVHRGGYHLLVFMRSDLSQSV
jgi:hypothetical protein